MGLTCRNRLMSCRRETRRQSGLSRLEEGRRCISGCQASNLPAELMADFTFTWEMPEPLALSPREQGATNSAQEGQASGCPVTRGVRGGHRGSGWERGLSDGRGPFPPASLGGLLHHSCLYHSPHTSRAPLCACEGQEPALVGAAWE